MIVGQLPRPDCCSGLENLQELAGQGLPVGC